MADYVLTVYADDDATPLFEVGTAATHAHPYLKTPQGGKSAEVDIVRGTASIGQQDVEIIDPQTGATQADRWLTALLGDTAGNSALNGRRAVLSQVSPAVVTLDGVISGVSLLPSFAAYKISLRDIRERGVKVRVFTETSTTSVLPRGVVDGYGKLPASLWGPIRWLVLPTVPLTGTYSGDADGGLILLDGAPSKPGVEVDPSLVVTQAMQDAMRMTGTPLVFDQVEVWWRAAGASDWVEGQKLRKIRAPKGQAILTPQGYTQYGQLVRTVRAKVKNTDGTTTDVLGAKAVYVDGAEGGTLPTNGQDVEVAVVYRGEPTDQYPFHFEGTWGEFVRNLLRGDYGAKDEADNLVELRIRYDEAALLAIDIPIRVRLTEPRDDLRAVLEDLCLMIGAALGVDDQGQVAILRSEVPDASVELPQVDDTNAVAIPGWDHPTTDAVTQVTVTYPRDRGVSADRDPNGDRSAGDGIVSEDVTILERAPQSVLDVMGVRDLKVDAWAFRALGNTDGEPISGDVTDETGAQYAHARKHIAIDRFCYGGASSTCRILVSDFPGLALGDWVLDARSWRPNYATGKRGGNALAQVVSIKQSDPAWYDVRLVDAAPSDSPATAPTLGAVTAATTGTVSVPVTALPAGVSARVDYALSETMPTTNSGVWTFLGRTDATSTLTSPAFPVGATVWIRARGEAVGRRPSAWSTPVSVTIPAEPRVLVASLKLTDTGVAVAGWEVNPSTLGVRLYYAAHDPALAPTLATYIDVAASAGTASPPITAAPGQAITVEIEPWSGWTGSAVSGTAGTRVRRVAVRAAEAQTLAMEYASDDLGSNESSTFDPAIHLFARQSTDGGVTWTPWYRIVGENGASAAGRYRDYIFCVAPIGTTPATPTGDPPTAPAGTPAVTWYGSPPTYNVSTDALWMSSADRDGADDSLLSATWDVPVRLTGAKGDIGATGPQGPQGIQGPAGADGESNYFHIAYADSADGTVNFNQSAGQYVGTYVDGSPTDSASPAAYQWQLFQGAQGPAGDQGIPGVDGADGQTSYLHIAYADDASGGGFSQSPGTHTYIGTYVDFVQTDSSDPAAYTWAKIQGPPGSGQPTAVITPIAETNEEVTLQYDGALGTGGVGPLQWSRNLHAGASDSWSAYAPYDPASPPTEVLTRPGAWSQQVQLRIKDASGLVGTAAPVWIQAADSVVDYPTDPRDAGGGWIRPTAPIGNGGRAIGDVRDDAATGRAGVGAEPINEVVNGGGQSDAVGAQASGWAYGIGVPLKVQSGWYADGDRSLSLDHAGVAQDSYSQQSFAVGAGEVIEVSGIVRIRATGGLFRGQGLLEVDHSGGAAELSVLDVSAPYVSASGVKIGLAIDGSTLDTQARVRVLLQVVSNGTLTLFLRNGGDDVSAGEVCFDGVRFVRRTGEVGRTFAALDADGYLQSGVGSTPAGTIEQGANKADGTIPATGELVAGVRVQQPTQQALNVTQGVKYAEVFDGDPVTFVPPFEDAAVVLFGMGGLTYDSNRGTQQSPYVRALNLDASGFTTKAKLRGPATTTPAQSDAFSGTSANKGSAAEAYDDTYTFHVDVILGKASVDGTPASVNLSFFTNDGSGQTLRATRSYTNSSQAVGATYMDVQVPVTVDGMNASTDDFIVVATLVGTGTSITRNPVTWLTAGAPSETPMTAANNAIRIPVLILGGT